MKPALVYDIETEGWTTFVCGAVYDGTTCESFRWHREKDMVARILSTPGDVVAHNGGRFDHLWLLDAAQRHGFKVTGEAVTNGSGIVSIQLGQTRLVDSYRLFPMNLRTLTAGAKDSLADLCTCGKKCGGYCAIRRKAPEKVLRKVEEYNRQDCVSLWDAIEHFRGVAEECGIDLGLTVGSTAWRSARDLLGLPAVDLDRNTWTLLRQGYYGGRVEVFRRESRAGRVYDVNSMYPWALASLAFPVGKPVHHYGPAAARQLRKARAGVYTATVHVPSMFVPPLPLRVRSGLAFPTGKITGSWTQLELQAAEEAGARVLRVHRSYTFARSEKLFAPWVDRVFALRMKYGKASREGAWLKLVLNSLSGKLGSRSVNRRVLLYPDGGDMAECTCKRGACSCGGYRPLDLTGRVWEARIEGRDLDPCAHVTWAAYLTSAARVRLLKFSGEDSVYCDTDSQFCEGERTEGIGPGLGQWSDQGAYRGFQALAPKVYIYESEQKTVFAAKGIPDAAKNWARISSGVPVEWERIAGLKGAKGGDFFRLIPERRTVARNTGRRIPDGHSFTRAPTAEELRAKGELE